MSETVLVVEDDATVANNVVRALVKDGHVAVAVGSCADALNELGHRSFDIVIVDLRLPDGDGLDVLDAVNRDSPATFALVMTAYASIESAIDALRRGAHDYVIKPLSLVDLRQKIERIARSRQTERENARLRAIVRGGSDAFATLRGSGPKMQAIADLVERVSPTQANVLVAGESGTGKDLVARALHERSARASGPFVAFSVGAIPESLVEAQLFGYERGANLDESAASEGLFRAASGGTLFLDDVGELTSLGQTKLLRAVETKEILPLGSDCARRVDVRIIAATHRDLEQSVSRGTFREDLYYRLNVVKIDLPPLRERRDEIPDLARQILDRLGSTYRRSPLALGRDASACLVAYGWPGNVRELSNVLERATILCDGDEIGIHHLPRSMTQAPAAVMGDRTGFMTGDPSDTNLERATSAFQREHVRRVVEGSGGSREDAARLLGLSPATLYRYLQKLGLKTPRAEEETS